MNQSPLSLFWLFYSCFIVCKTPTIKSRSPCSLSICFFISEGVCFTFVQEAERRKYLFVGLEVMNADSPTGGDRVVLGAGERGGSVSPAAALLMDGKKKIKKQKNQSVRNRSELQRSNLRRTSCLKEKQAEDGSSKTPEQQLEHQICCVTWAWNFHF